MKRDTYVSALTAALCEGKTPVYIDESGFTIEAVRHYAYAPRGAIVSDLRSSQQYRSPSLIAARLSDDFIAPLLFTGACNTERFNEWLETHLCAHLDQTYVVILDNARFHKSNRTQELINGCGASLLFLPPYSPDLNPIQKDFANIKRRWQYNAEKSIQEIINAYK